MQGFRRDSSQVIHTQTRQQCAIDLKRGILRGRANKHDRAVFNMRQKRILLTLVEAVYLVNKQHGSPSSRSGLPGLINCRPDLLNTSEHRRDLNKQGVIVRRDQSGERGLTNARRTPQDKRMQGARLDSTS